VLWQDVPRITLPDSSAQLYYFLSGHAWALPRIKVPTAKNRRIQLFDAIKGMVCNKV